MSERVRIHPSRPPPVLCIWRAPLASYHLDIQYSDEFDHTYFTLGTIGMRSTACMFSEVTSLRRDNPQAWLLFSRCRQFVEHLNCVLDTATAFPHLAHDPKSRLDLAVRLHHQPLARSRAPVRTAAVPSTRPHHQLHLLQLCSPSAEPRALGRAHSHTVARTAGPAPAPCLCASKPHHASTRRHQFAWHAHLLAAWIRPRACAACREPQLPRAPAPRALPTPTRSSLPEPQPLCVRPSPARRCAAPCASRDQPPKPPPRTRPLPRPAPQRRLVPLGAARLRTPASRPPLGFCRAAPPV
jgi:hypothetical protein